MTHDDETANLRRAIYDAFVRRHPGLGHGDVYVTFGEEAIHVDVAGVRWTYVVMGEDDEVLVFKTTRRHGNKRIEIERPEGV